MSKPPLKTPASETPAPEPHRLTTESVQIGPTPSLPGSRLKKK